MDLRLQRRAPGFARQFQRENRARYSERRLGIRNCADGFIAERDRAFSAGLPEAEIHRLIVAFPGGDATAEYCGEHE
jgi:hypothetical protein